MIRRDFIKSAIIGSGAIILGGCSPVGPNFSKPKGRKLPSSWKNSKKDPYLAHWWRIYGDRDLNNLVEKAFAQNLDIKMAGLRIVQARAALGISESMSLPQYQQLSGGVGISKDNRSDSIRSGFTQFDLGWEIDLWGKYARGEESAEAKLLASIASYDDIIVSILSEVARNYIGYRETQERIAYAKRNIAIQEYVAKVTKIQFNSGNVSELDMQQALTQLHSTKGAVYDLELTKIRYRNALSMLLGINPSEVERYINKRKYRDDMSRYIKKGKNSIQISEQKRDITSVSFIPSPKFNPHKSIDANLITRRPDVKVAEYLAHAKSADIGVTEAELYPSFSLLGNIKYADTSLSLSKISVIAGPSFAWNIFQYGRIKNAVRLKDAIFEEALLKYNKTLLTAVHDVSFALDSYRYTLNQLQESQKAVDASVRAFNISIKQYNDGLVSYQRLLNSVEKLTKYQDQYARLKGSLATQVALLYKALGGGWQISRGRSYLSKESIERMKSRSDWGKMLSKESVILPKGWRV